MFHLINAIYKDRSIILTINKGFTQWTDFFFYDIDNHLIAHDEPLPYGGCSIAVSPIAGAPHRRRDLLQQVKVLAKNSYV
jgi:hypothetical protein